MEEEEVSLAKAGIKFVASAMEASTKASPVGGAALTLIDKKDINNIKEKNKMTYFNLTASPL
jgi:hypothetical protein